ncbi:hypothetical protein RND81_14G105700 [Saponaria officinalis]|uniref:Leucine-rich repeat-containing N-terminal plant-type domain-containing protein n=1 Tax=Saponaria officinalis TaxID=3572 RepID=A0AAW1GSH0_SAPOF
MENVKVVTISLIMITVNVRVRDALLGFKHGIQVDRCGLLSTWGDGPDCCQWDVVRCENNTGQVIMLRLPGFPTANRCLEGTLAIFIVHEFIGSLSNLEQLNLSNAFGGVIPHEIGNLSRLSSLDLNCLDMNDCLMSVKSTWRLSRLKLLRYINLGSVDLSLVTNWVSIINNLPFVRGTSAFRWLHNLSRIESSLEYLDLSSNQLEGPISNTISNLKHLTVLVLSRNKLYFSKHALKSLGELCMLQTLVLNDINLTYDFSQVVESLSSCAGKSLVSLGLSNNQVYVTKKLVLNLSTSWTPPFQLVSLGLGSCKIGPNFPKWLLQNNNIRCLQSLHLRNNSLYGEIPVSWMNYMSLGVLDLAYNLLSGYIPPNFGISMDIPSSVCRLSCLQILDLSGNHLSGTLPNCLHNLSAMANTLNVTQACIDVSDNNLHSQIPDGISNHRGAIPSGIGQLTSLKFLDLSQNRLSGEIPTSLVSIDYLEILDFSKNNLSGKIPLGTHIYDNPGFCGAPLHKCPGDKATPASQNVDNIVPQNEHENDDIFLVLCIRVALGLITWFWGVCGALVLKRSWRLAVLRFYDDIIVRVDAIVVVNIHRNFRKLLS